MVKNYAQCPSMSRGGFPDQAETKCEPLPPPAFGKWRLTNEKWPGKTAAESTSAYLSAFIFMDRALRSCSMLLCPRGYGLFGSGL